MPIDLFQRLRPDKDLHPQFLGVRDSPYFSPARGSLRDFGQHFEDPDGNFVEQFQTFGFDSRTFELYLFAMLTDLGHKIDRSHPSPDFILENSGKRAALEAVTANAPGAGGFQAYNHFPKFETQEELDHYKRHDLAIRMGSPLYSKLRREYWKLPHVEGLPLILAIQDFHGQGSLMMTDAALGQYLYGLSQHWYHDPEGRLVISESPLDVHRIGAKEIPSGFFFQSDAEQISAVLFTNSGTIPKFNRMGQQGRYHSNDVRMIRFGTCYRHDPNSATPMPFLYEVGDPEWRETWRQGTVLFHNPRAVFPVQREWLGAALETDLEEGRPVARFVERFLPFWSVTMKFPASTPQGIIQAKVDEIEKDLAAKFPP